MVTTVSNSDKLQGLPNNTADMANPISSNSCLTQLKPHPDYGYETLLSAGLFSQNVGSLDIWIKPALRIFSVEWKSSELGTNTKYQANPATKVESQ